MNPSIRLTCSEFHVPKAGHAPTEYEDAFAGDVAQGRFAIADGASESGFANTWARILVDAYVETPGRWRNWLPVARERWLQEIQQRDLPWYAESKFEEGAYAAMLGVSFNGAFWEAAAVGDCCLFQMRDDDLLRAYPMRFAAEFGNRPSLLGSRPKQPTQPRTRRCHWAGDYRVGDVVLLATDALAQWSFQEQERGRELWPQLRPILENREFDRFVARLRSAREMRNDDVTLGVIQIRERDSSPGDRLP